jgi:hypothetical protein
VRAAERLGRSLRGVAAAVAARAGLPFLAPPSRFSTGSGGPDGVLDGAAFASDAGGSAKVTFCTSAVAYTGESHLTGASAAAAAPFEVLR